MPPEPGFKLAADWASLATALFARFVPAFADRFQSSWDLFGLSKTLVAQQHEDKNAGGPQDGDSLIWGTGTRSIKTYRGLLYLAALGHGPQAVMLARSLIEDTITTHWISENRQEAVRLIDLHERHNQHVASRILESRQLDLGELARLPRLSDAELAEMTSTFGEWGQWSWTGHRSLRSLYEVVRETWWHPNERDLLDHIVEIDLRYINQHVHNTAVSLARPLFPDGETALFTAEENDEDVAGALLIGFWAFANTHRLMLRTPYREPFVAFYQERMPTFFRSSET